MSTQPMTDPRNPVEESFSSRKGEVKLCLMCRNATLPPSMRLHCKWCMGSGYVAVCLPCKGTGIIRALAAWDDKSMHGSTCDTCGGLKFIPSRLSEFEKWEREHPPQAASATAPETETGVAANPAQVSPVVPPLPVTSNPPTSEEGKSQGAEVKEFDILGSAWRIPA
jgi:hypothetical protein